MAFFQRRNFVWNEPWFFLHRIRTARAWFLFSLFLSFVVVAVAVGIAMMAPANKPPSPLTIIGLSLGVSAALWWILDGTDSRRQAVLFEDSIVVGGDMGKYSTPTTYRLANIPGAAIVMPEESQWPVPALYFVYEGQEQAIGIDRSVSLPRLAQAIHDAGVPIRLNGWTPNQDNEFARSFSWSVDENSIQPTAVIEQLPADTVGFITPGGIALAIVRQCWALGTWLALASVAGYYAYQNWNQLGLIQLGLGFALVLGGLWLAAQITDRFASASSSKGLGRMVKNQIAKRRGVDVDLNGPDLVPVEIFTRDQFDKTIQKILEMGYIQPDRTRSRIVFEGKKERWRLPSNSIRSLAIEEVQCGTPGQSAMGSLNYYVVIRFATSDGEKELGLRYADRDYGDVTDTKRAAGGVLVFEAIESILPSNVLQDV
jgi:hypothetical protein